MRELPLSAAISVIAHGAAIAYLVLPRDAPRSSPTPPPIAVATRTEPLPIEITLVDDAPLARPIAPAAPAPPAAHPAAIATARLPAPTIPAHEAAHDPGASPLTMRPQDAPSPALPADILAQLDRLPRAPARVESVASGGRTGATLDHRMFDAKVAADGTVQLTDRRNVRVGIAAQQLLDDYLHSDTTLGGPAGDPAIASKYEPAPGTAISLGGSSSVNATPSSATLSHNLDRKGTTIVAPLISGTFDASDAVMRRHGADPYRARKLQFLDATRDERVQLGNLNRAEQLAHASQLMQRNLDALWRDGKLDLAGKKRSLFELWDECAEDGDARLVDSAGDARRQVIAFIRDHLPAGSAGAYTPRELGELARHQQSRAVFQPYE